MERRVTDLTTTDFDNLVVIFMESLEGWPLGLTVEGCEITPHLIAESSGKHSRQVFIISDFLLNGLIDYNLNVLRQTALFF